MITNYISEDYCSEETRSLLEEKGYIGTIYTYLDKDGFMVKEITLQSALKWLREVHKLGVFPTTYYREMNRNTKYDYGSIIIRLDTHEVIGNDKNIEDYTFEAETYEETADKAIRYCLENLI